MRIFGALALSILLAQSCADKADTLSWDGERLTVGFDTAPYEAVIKVDKGAGYLRFTLEDFLRGIAMILVIFGHCHCPVDKWLLAFHLP